MIKFPKKIFVTGTDTGIGKTVVSSVLVSGLGASYWKPIQAGRDPLTDTETVKMYTGLPGSHFYEESYNLAEPMSPHAAAQIDGLNIKFDKIRIPEFSTDHLVIEGAGGLIVPVNDRQYTIDLISFLDVPVLLVAKSGLGTLNHTLLSLEALRNRNVSIFGVILVGERHDTNEKAILTYGRPARLFRLGLLPDFKPAVIKQAFQSAFSVSIDRSHHS